MQETLQNGSSSEYSPRLLPSPGKKDLFRLIVDANRVRGIDACDLDSRVGRVSLFLERGWGGVEAAGVTFVGTEKAHTHLIETDLSNSKAKYHMYSKIETEAKGKPFEDAKLEKDGMSDLYDAVLEAHFSTPIESRAIDAHERADFWTDRLQNIYDEVRPDELWQVGMDVIAIRMAQRGVAPQNNEFADAIMLDGAAGRMQLFHSRDEKSGEEHLEVRAWMGDDDAEIEANELIKLTKSGEKGSERFSAQHASEIITSPLVGLSPNYDGELDWRPINLDQGKRLIMAYNLWDAHLNTVAEPRYPILVANSAYPNTHQMGLYSA